MDTNGKTGSASPLWYFLGGAAAGTVLGLLFAPRAGKETRENLTELGRRGREKSRELIDKVSEMLPSGVK